VEEKLDAIIVGAGLAGCSAAIKLARSGLIVALIERGAYPGSKNLSGGVLYGRILETLIPEFWREAPIERCITNHITTFLSSDAWFGLDYKTSKFGQPPYNGHTVLRAKFDNWLAEKAEQAGVMLVPGIRVDALVWKDECITGVVAGEDTLLADVVIAADGANSFLAQQAGLRGGIEPKHIAVGIKSLVGLPRGTIEERFHLNVDEGVAYALVGEVTKGIAGGGFLYTNNESLSIGVVIRLDDLLKNRKEASEIAENFLHHPLIAPLVKGGELLEYGAHLVPEGGLEMMPRLGMPGMLVVGDAAGFAINTALVVRGMDLAIGSGLAAAQAVLHAKSKNQFGLSMVQDYSSSLEQSFVMKDMRTYARMPAFLEIERLYTHYPKFVTELIKRIFICDSLPKEHVSTTTMKALKTSGISLRTLAGDILKGALSL
jgi:electron transfer flavoprotein-quinone oxidoreductase